MCGWTTSWSGRLQLRNSPYSGMQELKAREGIDMVKFDGGDDIVE